MGTTKISWCDVVWNPVTGCTKIDEGCKNCYAERMTRRFWKQWGCEAPPNHFKVKIHPDRLTLPYSWHKRRRVFVNSMSDLFHEDVPFAFLRSIWQVMLSCKQHSFIVLTKRPENARRFAVETLYMHDTHYRPIYPNVWLGVSVSTQADTDRLRPRLMDIPAAIQKVVSVEPLLERIDLRLRDYTISHVIVGSESGPKRRPCDIAWIRDVVWQCRDKKVPVFVKQMEINGKVTANPDDWPEDLRIQEFPK